MDVSRILHFKNLAAACGGWVSAPLRLVFPDVCQACLRATAFAEDGYICSSCVKLLRPIQIPYCHRCGLPFEGEMEEAIECLNCHDMHFYFESARSATVANVLMIDLLHRFKYQGALWLEHLFERLFLDLLSNDPVRTEWDCIVPVPLHPVRERERGYNQSALLAKRVADGLEVPFYGKALKRIAPTPSQTMLDRKERVENVSNAFEVTDEAALKSQGVLLIDDMLTTGATSNACAKELRKAGARVVSVRTLARGLGVST